MSIYHRLYNLLKEIKTTLIELVKLLFGVITELWLLTRFMNILRFSADSGKLCTWAYNSANAFTVGSSSFSFVVVDRSVNENTVVATVPSS